jgi:hypothetical protein
MTPPDLAIYERSAIPNHHDLRKTTPALAALRMAEEHENVPPGIICFFLGSSCDQLLGFYAQLRPAVISLIPAEILPDFVAFKYRNLGKAMWLNSWLRLINPHPII